MYRFTHLACPLFLIALTSSAHAQSVTEILARANPAVVTISTNDAKGRAIGQGSGFVVNVHGLVITAWHVVADAATATVKMQDGKIYKVTGVIYKDAKKDVAALLVDADELPYIPVGDSDKVHQGDRILTIGTPRGLEGTASEGMVSAIRRVGPAVHLQITAPISPGNSGGPVLNMQGQAVGIAVFYLRDSQSLNFAVAMNEVTPGYSAALNDKTLAISRLPNAPDPERIEKERLAAELARASRIEKATLAADKARRVAENAKLLHYSAPKLYEMGTHALTAGKQDEALLFFDAACVKNPKMVDAWSCAASASQSMQGSVDRLTHGLRLNPRASSICVELADKYRYWGGHDTQAMATYELARRISREPLDLWQALTGLATCEARLRHYENVIHALKAATAVLGPDSTTYFREGFAYERLGRHSDAENMLALGRKLVKTPFEAWDLLGDAWRDSDDFGFGESRWKYAADAYSKAIQSGNVANTKSLSYTYCSLAEAYTNLKRWQDVIDTYLHVLRTDPNCDEDGSLRRKLGEAYLKLGDLESAKNQYATILATHYKSAEYGKSEASSLRDAIASYGVPIGKIKVHGLVSLDFYYSKASSGIRHAAVFVDDKLTNLDVAGSSPLVNLYFDMYPLVLDVKANALEDGLHKVQVNISIDNRVVSSCEVSILVDNAHPDEALNMKYVEVDLLETTPALPH